MATVDGDTFSWKATAAVTAVLTVIECVRLPLAPCTVMAPLPTAAAPDAETPMLRGSEGEAAKGGPLEEPSAATEMPAGRFGNVIVTDPAKPLAGLMEIVSWTPFPCCCSESEDGAAEIVKSGTGGGGVLLPPPPPQPARLTVAARRTMTDERRTKEKLRSEDAEPNITRSPMTCPIRAALP